MQLVSAKSLAPHVRGSFEAIREAVIAEIGRSSVFGTGRRVALVATHPDHVVVVAEDLGSYKLPYVCLPDGQTAFGIPQRLEADLVDKTNVVSHIETTAAAAVDALLRGDVTEACEVSASLLPYALPGLIRESQADRPGLGSWTGPQTFWRQLYARIADAPLAEGAPVYGTDPAVLPTEAHRAAVEAALVTKIEQAGSLRAEISTRYVDVAARKLHEGPLTTLGTLSLDEWSTLLEGFGAEVFMLVTEGQAALQAESRTPVTALVRLVDDAARVLPGYSVALVTMDATLYPLGNDS